MLDNADVYTAKALEVSAAMLFGVLFFHACYMVVVNKYFRLTASYFAQKKEWALVELAFLLGAFILAFAHIIEIFLLGYSIYLMGLVSNLHKALVFAGSTYTTVGFGTDPLPPGWQLVMVTMALCGLLTIAWTTSILLAMAVNTHNLIEKSGKASS